jgi:hypothetical protein
MVRLDFPFCYALLASGLLGTPCCGGKVSDTTEPPSRDAGPVHVGAGSYDASVNATSDTCNPPLFTGSAGSQVVVVAVSSHGFGFNVPLCSSGADVPPPLFSCPRRDFSDDRAFDVTLDTGYLDCGAQQMIHGQVLSFDGDGIDIEYKVTFVGLANCPDTGVLPMSDCTSDRIFRYRWLKSCDVDASVVDPISCK